MWKDVEEEKKTPYAVEGGCSADYLHQSLKTHTIKMKVQSAGQLPVIRSHCWKGEKHTVSVLAEQAAIVHREKNGEIAHAALRPRVLVHRVVLIDFSMSWYSTANLGELQQMG